GFQQDAMEGQAAQLLSGVGDQEPGEGVALQVGVVIQVSQGVSNELGECVTVHRCIMLAGGAGVKIGRFLAAEWPLGVGRMQDRRYNFNEPIMIH
ncbi:MAG: hypothetical protein QXZ09_06720, partial [Candidatus Methanomethylicaceae archaeon]